MKDELALNDNDLKNKLSLIESKDQLQNKNID